MVDIVTCRNIKKIFRIMYLSYMGSVTNYGEGDYKTVGSVGGGGQVKFFSYGKGGAVEKFQPR